MTEVFEELAVIDDAGRTLACKLTEVFLCALESNDTVPSMEKVTERLLHEERKMKGTSEADKSHGLNSRRKVQSVTIVENSVTSRKTVEVLANAAQVDEYYVHNMELDSGLRCYPASTRILRHH